MYIYVKVPRHVADHGVRVAPGYPEFTWENYSDACYLIVQNVDEVPVRFLREFSQAYPDEWMLVTYSGKSTDLLPYPDTYCQVLLNGTDSYEGEPYVMEPQLWPQGGTTPRGFVTFAPDDTYVVTLVATKDRPV